MKINGVLHYQCRAANQDTNEIDIFLQTLSFPSSRHAIF
jgi:hypothetical protein